jgi:hypothetical protein
MPGHQFNHAIIPRWRPNRPAQRRGRFGLPQINLQDRQAQQIPIVEQMNQTILAQRNKLQKKTLKITKLKQKLQAQQIKTAECELRAVNLFRQYRTEIRTGNASIALQDRELADRQEIIDELRTQLSRIPMRCQEHQCFKRGPRSFPECRPLAIITTNGTVKDEARSPMDISPIRAPTPQIRQDSSLLDPRIVTQSRWWSVKRGSTPLGDDYGLSGCMSSEPCASGSTIQSPSSPEYVPASTKEMPDETQDGRH